MQAVAPHWKTMTTLYSHPDIFLHDAHASHVAMEATRMSEIYDAVSRVPGIALRRARQATRDEFERIHSPEYLDLLSSPLEHGQVLRFNGETIVNAHTWTALAYSAGAVCEAVEEALAGKERHAFCVGYAGHHAQDAAAQGFCFTNPVAIGARHALALGAKRVAVLDFDTHSGNGTILSLMDEPAILFAETYQKGFPGEFLPGRRPDNIRRIRCDTAVDFRRGWAELFAAVGDFDPDVILVSAGFDAHKADPLGLIGLQDSDYAWFARTLTGLDRPVVATLEGGYSVADTARCAALFVTTLREAETPEHTA